MPIDLFSNPRILPTLILVVGALGYFWYYWVRQKKGGGSRRGSTLESFTRDLTADAERDQFDPVIGRDEEIERVIHILARRSKNNPLLLGEPGVGKTAIVEGIALRLVANDVPDCLRGKRLLALDLGGLISGTKYRGEFEERLTSLTNELKALKGQVMLFIDEVHMIEQAKGTEGALNISDILKPELSRGDIQIIGATTWREYQTILKPDDALDRRFQPVLVGEPSRDAALAILRGLRHAYEAHHGVVYNEDALEAAVDLSRKFIENRYLPDKAIDVIDEAGAKVSIEAGRGTKHVLGVLHAAGKGTSGRFRVLRKERDRVHKEIDHMRALAKDLREPELNDIERRLERLAKEMAAIDSKVAKGTVGGKPHVTAKDIKDVVVQWAGVKA